MRRDSKKSAQAPTPEETVVEEMRRLRTGVPGLDTMLRGGFPQYAVVIIAGLPGTGKTILCQQILFNNLHHGKRCVYLSTLSESSMKVARYQSRFSFFDPDKFGTSIIYMDIGQVIRAQGLDKAMDTIITSVRKIEPVVVAIDSFKAIHDLAPSPKEMRAFIYDISIELAAIQSTSLLVGEYSEEDIASGPEFAIADGIVQLYTEKTATHLSRYLRVLKMRGVDHSTSAENFDITRNGLEVYTTEGLIPGKIPPYQKDLTKTGLPELDGILRGGIPKGAPMLLTGGAGTGKTTLGLQFLYEGATRYGEKGIFFTYEEVPDQLIANAQGFGWDLQKLIDEGKLRIFHVPLPEVNPNEQLLAVRRAIHELGAQRAVIDSLTMMMPREVDPTLVRAQIYNLVAVLKYAACTTFIISDPPAGTNAISRFGVEESIIDGVILLKMVSEKRGRVRYLEVYKFRGVNHAAGDNMMKITRQGIKVFPRVEEVLG